MTKRIKLGVNEKVPIELSTDQRDLVLDHIFAGPELTRPLTTALLSGKKIVVHYTLSEIDELIGFVAAAANQSADPKRTRKFDRLYEYLKTFEDRYEDEHSVPRP